MRLQVQSMSKVEENFVSCVGFMQKERIEVTHIILKNKEKEKKNTLLSCTSWR